MVMSKEHAEFVAGVNASLLTGGLAQATTFVTTLCHEQSPIDETARDQVLELVNTEMDIAINYVEAAKYSAKVAGKVVLFTDEKLLMGVLAYRLVAAFTAEDRDAALNAGTDFLRMCIGTEEDKQDLDAFSAELDAAHEMAEAAFRHAANVAPVGSRN